MARRGLFSRIRDLFGFGESSRRVPIEPEPTPEPPRRQRREYDPYERIWIEERLARPGGHQYRANLALFREIPGIEDESEFEQKRLWRIYTREFIQPGGMKRNDVRNPFWNELGMHPDDFDWHGFREAMGYPHGNRRR